MSIEQILRAAQLPVTVAELKQATGYCDALIYMELVSMEASGLARPILRYAGSSAGWIYVN